MGQKEGREIVIELERVQLVRKCAGTVIRHCDGCGTASDTISHSQAAELFEIGPQSLLDLVHQNGCHFTIDHEGTAYLCVSSLLRRISKADLGQTSNTKLLGGFK